ncbi:MAG TPA: O-antigen ligase family protein [Defluviitaleaceae bacterium]|nr:O-antigen ligase family protein [Defluviitaleaceae bacterium]
MKGGRLALSENSNPNNDGLTLFYGVFCFLMLLDTKKINRLLLSLGLIGLFSYTIILTGSRKSFMALVILLFLWFFLVFRRYWKLYSLPQKIILLLVAVIISSIAMSQFISILLDSTLFKRLIEGGYSISSDKTRSGMYQEAIKFFIDNPLCGIGFNHYRLLSRYQTYSHSTYAEIISTTGIIGTLIYFLPYIIIIYNLFLLYIRKKGTMTSLKSLQYLILMATMLALGIGVIHFYNITDNIMFALMISFYQVEKNKQRSH